MKQFFATLAAILVAAAIIYVIKDEADSQKRWAKIHADMAANKIQVNKQAEESQARLDEEIRLTEEFNRTHPGHELAIPGR